MGVHVNFYNRSKIQIDASTLGLYLSMRCLSLLLNILSVFVDEGNFLYCRYNDSQKYSSNCKFDNHHIM
jgi:hypothetical protein